MSIITSKISNFLIWSLSKVRAVIKANTPKILSNHPDINSGTPVLTDLGRGANWWWLGRHISNLTLDTTECKSETTSWKKDPFPMQVMSELNSAKYRKADTWQRDKDRYVWGLSLQREEVPKTWKSRSDHWKYINLT